MNVEDREFLSTYVEGMKRELEEVSASMRILIDHLEDILAGKQPDKQSYDLSWGAFLETRSLQNYASQAHGLIVKNYRTALVEEA